MNQERKFMTNQEVQELAIKNADIFKKVFICYSEGTNEWAGKTFTSILEFEAMLAQVFEPGAGYNKVGFNLTILEGDTGQEKTHRLRLDVGEAKGDFLPGRDTFVAYCGEVWNSRLVEEAPAVDTLEGVKDKDLFVFKIMPV